MCDRNVVSRATSANGEIRCHLSVLVAPNLYLSRWTLDFPCNRVGYIQFHFHERRHTVQFISIYEVFMFVVALTARSPVRVSCSSAACAVG